MTQHNREMDLIEHHKNCLAMLKVIIKAGYEKTYYKYIKQAEDRGAEKLAEELLGSEEMKELIEIPYEKHEYCLPHEHCFDCDRNTEIKSHNKTVTAIKAKIKELCPTTTPSST